MNDPVMLKQSLSAMLAAAALSTAVAPVPATAQEAGEIPAEVVDKLFDEHATPAAFTDALRFAEDAGVDPQTLVEAQIVFYLFRKTDIAGVRKTLRRVDKIAPDYDPAKSRLFKTKREFTAMAEYARAIIALTNGDEAALKKHITEAFWLDPDHADTFAGLVSSHLAGKKRIRDGEQKEKAETKDSD